MVPDILCPVEHRGMVPELSEEKLRPAQLSSGDPIYLSKYQLQVTRIPGRLKLGLVTTGTGQCEHGLKDTVTFL